MPAQRPFTDIPISTWLQIATLLVLGGISYATVVGATDNLTNEQAAQKAIIESDRAANLQIWRDQQAQINALANQFSRLDERVLGVGVSVDEVKQNQRETNSLIRSIQSSISQITR